MKPPQLDLFGGDADRVLAESDARDRRPAQLDLAPGVKASARLTRKMRGEERRREAVAARPSLDQRYAEFAMKNPHVFRELLRLARARLDRGETFIAIKALWEELRVSLQVSEDGGAGPEETTDGKIAVSPWKLNNDFTALYARALIRAEPRLENVMRLRARKHH